MLHEYALMHARGPASPCCSNFSIHAAELGTGAKMQIRLRTLQDGQSQTVTAEESSDVSNHE